MVNTLYLPEHVRHGFDNIKVVILVSKMASALEHHNSAKMNNFRRYGMKTQLNLNLKLGTALNVSQKRLVDVHKQWGRLTN